MEQDVATPLVEDPVFRTRYAFERKTDDQGREVLLVDAWVDPGGGVTAHVHPAMEERFKVLSGRPDFLAGRKWETAEPGAEVVVPPGTRHAFRNRGHEIAHFRCTARPPSTLEQFLRDAAGLSRAGKLTRNALPTGPAALLQIAVMANHYRDMVMLSSPPPALQRLLIPPLAKLGERRGQRAGSFAELA